MRACLGIHYYMLSLSWLFLAILLLQPLSAEVGRCHYIQLMDSLLGFTHYEASAVCCPRPALCTQDLARSWICSQGS